MIPAHGTTITHRNTKKITHHIPRRGNYRHDVLAILPFTILKFVKGLERKLKRSLECLAPEDQSRRAIKGRWYIPFYPPEGNKEAVDLLEDGATGRSLYATK
jgi:hypothetical protein